MIDQHLSAYVAMTPGEKSAPLRARTAATLNAKREEFLADLRMQQAEYRRIEDECGVTAARETARATAETVKQLDREIIAYVPATLAEAARKAAWIVEVFDGCDSYIAETDQLLEALAAIGRASA